MREPGSRRAFKTTLAFLCNLNEMGSSVMRVGLDPDEAK